MKLFYYQDPHGNFGDDVNAWLWNRFIPEAFQDENDGVTFSGIGTIIGPRMHDEGRWIVFGSGIGYGPPPPSFGGTDWRIPCVRGPLTTRMLGLPESAAVVDPAVLIGTLPEYAPLPDSEREGVLFMPHHEALSTGAWRAAAERAGLGFVDPRDDSKQTIERLRRAKLVVADAMHAAIVADCLRTPWVAVSTSSETSTFKWLDWSQSLGMGYTPQRLPASTAQEGLRSATLHLYGKRFTTEPNPDAAVRHLTRDLASKRHPWSYRRRATGHALYRRVLKKGLAAKPLDGWRADADARSLDRAAEALRRAALGAGQLSNDKILGSKTAQLRDLLLKVGKEGWRS